MKKSEWCNQLNIVTVYNDFSGYICHNPSQSVKCPFHDDSNPSMKLYTNTNRWVCFACGNQGSVIDFIIELKHVNFIEAINILTSKYNYTDTEDIKNPEAYNKAKTIYAALERIANYWSNSAIAYWASRGISTDVQKQYKLGYAAPDLVFNKDIPLYNQFGLCNMYGKSAYAGRYIIPIRNKFGYICGFAGRTGDESGPKYVNSSDSEYFHKSEILFNYDVAKEFGTIYVVEGYMDALSLVTAGIKNVVATMGTALTTKHIEMLKGKEIILAFDTDNAGLLATYNTIVKYPETKFKILAPLDGVKDFNELLISKGADAVVKAVTSAQDGIMWLIEYLCQHHDLTNAPEVDKTWEILSGVIGAIEEAYQSIKPMNINYTPVALRRYWAYYYNKIEEVK